MPSWAYRLIDGPRPKLWAIFFFALGVAVALLLILIFYSLTINLEGSLGRAVFSQSWIDWFTSYNPEITNKK